MTTEQIIDKPFKCDRCDAAFENARALNLHCLGKHDRSPNVGAKPKPQPDVYTRIHVLLDKRLAVLEKRLYIAELESQIRNIEHPNVGVPNYVPQPSLDNHTPQADPLEQLERLRDILESRGEIGDVEDGELEPENKDSDLTQILNLLTKVQPSPLVKPHEPDPGNPS